MGLITDILHDKSNRGKHFLYAIPCAAIATILFVLGLSFGMEFKDARNGGRWDWKDIAATVMGGIVGQLLQLTIIYLSL